jgi:hypothetical protein
LTTFTPTLKVGSSVNGDQYNAKKITIDGETVVYATLAGITWATTN